MTGDGSFGVTGNRTADAAGAATTEAELAAGDGDDVNAGLAEPGVGVDVAFIGDHHAGADGEDVAGILPPLTVASGGEGLDAVNACGRGEGVEDRSGRGSMSPWRQRLLQSITSAGRS